MRAEEAAAILQGVIDTSFRVAPAEHIMQAIESVANRARIVDRSDCRHTSSVSTPPFALALCMDCGRQFRVQR